MRIPFMKMTGSGNDFILIDHRNPFIPEDRMQELARKICRRKFSIGADGLIFIEGSREADFKWRFFNSDGSEAEMCGNGGRCAARFAHVKGITGPRLRFETLAGVLSASVRDKRVRLEMTTPHDLKLEEKLFIDGEELVLSSVNTGVPHAVCFLRDVSQFDVVRTGRAIRNHAHFAPAGTNADFVQVEDGSRLKVRTYERGVEDETLACGTGAVAAAVIAGLRKLVNPPVSVQTSGGEVLSVDFQIEAGRVAKVFFEGEVRIIYEGEMWEEAYV